MSCNCNTGRGSDRCGTKGPKGDKGEPGIQGVPGIQGPAGAAFSVGTYTAFAGGGQTNATNLLNNDNLVATVASNNDSVKLLPATVGVSQTVRNAGVNSLNVFPQTGENIDGAGANVPYPIPAGGAVTFVCFSTGNYTV